MLRLPTETQTNARPRAVDFFAGIGLARLGLEASGVEVVWANDSDPDKCLMYKNNFGDALESPSTYSLTDIANIGSNDIPHLIDIAWASFPCVDLSLAGNRMGFAGQHSGTFWQFARVLAELGGRRPPVIVLENVVGLVNSHNGQDLFILTRELNRLGYSVDIFTIDSRHFVPQSRPRLFVVGSQEQPSETDMRDSEIRPHWLRWPHDHPELRTHRLPLPALPPMLTQGLSDLIEEVPPDDERWWNAERVQALTDSLSPAQRARLDVIRQSAEPACRTAYRRTRQGVARWEIRPDDISGCLRTARGGSSKQALVRAGSGRVQARWMTPREYARLMGAPNYKLEGIRRNQAFSGFGDAVAVPVVQWLATHCLRSLSDEHGRSYNVEIMSASA